MSETRIADEDFPHVPAGAHQAEAHGDIRGTYGGDIDLDNPHLGRREARHHPDNGCPEVGRHKPSIDEVSRAMRAIDEFDGDAGGDTKTMGQIDEELDELMETTSRFNGLNEKLDELMRKADELFGDSEDKHPEAETLRESDAKNHLAQDGEEGSSERFDHNGSSGTISLQESETYLMHPDTTRADKWIYRNSDEDEVPEGYHRVVGTYDDLVPVSWIDIPDGTSDPMPNYLSTSMARIYLGESLAVDWDENLPESFSLAGVATRQRHRSEGRRDGTTAMGVIRLASLLVTFLMSVTALALSGGHMPLVLSCLLVMGAVLSFGMLVVGVVPIVMGQVDQRRRERIASAMPGTGELPPATDVTEVLRACRNDAGIGCYARDGIRQLDESQSLYDRLIGLIGKRFSEGSISWHRFADGCEAGCESIRRNVTMMASIMARLDADGSGEGTGTDSPDESQAGILSGLVSDNEEILAELRNLEAEMLRLTVDELSQGNHEVASDLRRMSDEVRYYKSTE